MQGFQEKPTKMIILELCDGNATQLFLLKKGGDFQTCFKAIKDIAAGCKRIHSLGIIHFDIKSDNILFKKISPSTYTFKVSDFGVSGA